MKVFNTLRETGLMAGVLMAAGVKVGDSPEALRESLSSLIEKRSREESIPSGLNAAVRDMLRTPAYKPTGRGKPASEYLVQAAREGRFPFINNLVDINNFISLESGLPASLLDLGVVGEDVVLRLGAAGEKYTFNQTGQEIDLHGLACVCACRGDKTVPLGNPVKDSLEAKVKLDTTSVVGVVYAPAKLFSEETLLELSRKFAGMLEAHAGAIRTEVLAA